MDKEKGGKYAGINTKFMKDKADERVKEMKTKLKDKWLKAFQNKFYDHDNK